MKTNFSLPSQTLTNDGIYIYNHTGFQNNDNNSISKDCVGENLARISLDVTTGVICLFGFVGNGNAIWLLGFRIRRNPFMIYILNLAVADFAFLIFSLVKRGFACSVAQTHFPVLISIVDGLFLYMYDAGQFLLTAISIDRCVSILFPIWYRCRCPSHMSKTVCALIWLLTMLLNVIYFIFILRDVGIKYHLGYLVLTSLLYLPCMVIATLTIFIQVCFKPNLLKRKKLLRVILLTLFLFLLLGFPINAIYIMNFFSNDAFHYLKQYGFICACLNSSINPLVYFLVGRQKHGRCKESMKIILQRVFKEERDFSEELESTSKIQHPENIGGEPELCSH